MTTSRTLEGIIKLRSSLTRRESGKFNQKEYGYFRYESVSLLAIKLFYYLVAIHKNKELDPKLRKKLGKMVDSLKKNTIVSGCPIPVLF